MPQLNPSPWFMILVFSWLIFLIILPPKVLLPIAVLVLLPTVAILKSVVLFLLTLLEVAVAMIQAYLFVLLLSLYLQENV